MIFLVAVGSAVIDDDNERATAAVRGLDDLAQERLRQRTGDEQPARVWLLVEPAFVTLAELIDTDGAVVS